MERKFPEKGFYYRNSPITERCYYITGEKKGNKWIEVAGISGNEIYQNPNACWMPLNWMAIDNDFLEMIKNCTYSETNPIEEKFPLKIK